MLSMCTFVFYTNKSYQKVFEALLYAPFRFSTEYGKVKLGLQRCITVYGDKAIDNVRNACKQAGISYMEV